VANTGIPKFLGRYEIVRELGKGAMGVVYEGRDPNIGRRVAIKTMRKDVMESSGRAEEMLERFLREAQAAGLLNHPNIITIYDAGEEGDTAYIAMEFIEGSSLRDTLEKRGMLEPEEIAELGATICEALAAAHDAGIVHRDIKPDNILLQDKGPLKVADFGIARMSNSNLTQDGELIGTPYYMSPEQFMGQKIDGRSDLFSLAVILYEMLTNEKPFHGEALTAMMHNVINSNPIPPQKLNYSIPNPMGDVVMKALSKRAADRYPDGRAFAKALRECVKAKPDPKLLGLSPDSNATVLSSSGLGGGDTVIGGGQQISQMSATMAGAPPASSLMDELEQGDTPKRSSAPHGETKAQKNLLPLIAAGIAAILLLAGGAYFFMGGEAKPGTAPNVAGSTSSNMATATFHVYGTEDLDAQLAFENIAYDGNAAANWKKWEDEYIKSVIPLDDAKVSLKNKTTGESQTLKGLSLVQIPEDLSPYVLEVTADGYLNVEYTDFKNSFSQMYVLLQKE